MESDAVKEVVPCHEERSTAKKVRKWLARVGVKMILIEHGSPWENGYCESFNGRRRDELLGREQYDVLPEAKVLIERWRWHYNTLRPHRPLGYRPPGTRNVPVPFDRFGYASAIERDSH